MYTIKISILVPVYNVEEYLSRCIESVLSQDFANYELILVDDGSSDRSGNICDDFVKKCPERIKVIHKVNGGLPSARLVGFQNANGKYIMFLDSDDWLLPGALSTLYNKIEEGYDIVKGINRRVYNNGNYTIERHSIYNEEIIGNENYLSKVINADIAPYLWGGLYRKDLIQEEDFIQILNFSVGEDWLLNIAIARRVNKMVCIDQEIYCYFINNNSIMQSKVCSHEYGDRMKTLVEYLTSDYGKTIKFWVNINKTYSLIINNFIPELQFNNDGYNIIIENIKDKDIYSIIKLKVNKKFLLFIEYKYIYKLYCWLFKSTYRIIKLKNTRRKILY